MNCPVCASSSVRSLNGHGRVFSRCGFCGFSWAEACRPPQPEAGFLAHIIDRALSFIGNPQHSLQVLDWGSGLHSQGIELLARRGIQAAPGDPQAAPPQESFDLLFCMDAARGFTHPRQEFRSLAKTLKPGGWAFLHTPLSPWEDEAFLRWRYIQDTAFYSEKSLQILASVGSLSMIQQEEETLTILRKPLPVLVAGGINLDMEGRPYKKMVFRDSNPGKICFSAGGCARNIAENLSRLGLATELVSPLGADTLGEDLRNSSKTRGIGIAGLQVLPGQSTSAYLSLLDEQGDMAAAVSGMAIFDAFTPALAAKSLEHAAASAYDRSFGGDPEAPFSAMILDGNLLPETSLFMTQRFPALPCWFDPVSVAKTRRIAAYQGGAFFDKLEGIKLNVLEAQALGEDWSPDPLEPFLDMVKTALQGVPVIYVTLGSKGVLRMDKTGEVLFRGPSLEPVSATGAGDSFLAASLWQRILGNGQAQDDLIAGSAGAFITLKSPQAVSSDMDPETLESLILAWNQQAWGVIKIVGGSGGLDPPMGVWG